MEAQHPRVVHLVDVVARQDDQVTRRLALDRVEVLIDGIGRALIPVFADPLLRMQDFDELAQLVGHDAPPDSDVTGERQRLVLKGDEDLPQARVDAVAQGEVDDPIRPAEIDRRLGPLLGERIQPLADAPGQHHHDGVIEHGIAPSLWRSRCGGKRGT